MKKEIMTAIGNEEGYYKFIFIKSKYFYHFLYKFFNEIGIKYEIQYEVNGEECNPLDSVDIWEEFKNDKYHIEIFYGCKKIIMIIRLREEDKEKISKKVFKYSEFKKN